MDASPGAYPTPGWAELCEVTDGDVLRLVEQGQAVVFLPGPTVVGGGESVGTCTTVDPS